MQTGTHPGTFSFVPDEGQRSRVDLSGWCDASIVDHRVRATETAIVDILYFTVKTQKTVRKRMTAMSTRMIPVTKKTYSWGLITERVYGVPCQLPDCTLSV